MDVLGYHKLRKAVQQNAYPGSGRDLASMERSLRNLLMASGIFEAVEVERTDDPDQLVIALCRFSTDRSEVDVARQIEQLWQDRMQYPFWEAHALRVGEEYVEFQAATRKSDMGHYVTVHVVAEASPIPAQRVSSE